MENQNNEITKIRDGYMPRERTKLDELKTLDKKAKTFPSVFAYILGSVAALILGTGMCLAMHVIGAPTLSPVVLTTLGVITGCIGIALCSANYFIYKKMLKSRKAKYRDRILELSEELLNK